jgi:pilus assembly protein CpaC
MPNFSNNAWGLALATMAMATIALFQPVASDDALAGGDPPRFSASPRGIPYSTEHQSVLRISEREGLPQHRGIKLGKSKSMLVELPRDLRDVIVSSPDIMDAVVQSSNRVYLIGKKVGQANAFFFDANGEQILTLEVSVEQDTAVMEATFRRLIPGSRIKAEMLNETVILTGSVRNPADSARASDLASRFIVSPTPDANQRHKEKVINMLVVEGEEQVMLKVVVAEMQRTILKQLGVNLGASIQAGNFGLNILTENALPLTAAAGLGRLPVALLGVTGTPPPDCTAAGLLCNWNSNALNQSGTFGNSGVAGGWASGGQQISQALRMLERDGLIRTLAEPNLTAISGESANFLAGGEYPIPVVDSQGKMSVTFKRFGISLAFTPVVLSEGRISIKIETEVSELSNQGAVVLNGISIPALKKREARSVVELPSGGTIAMAGLISDETKQNIDGFPGLKDIAILGTLFRSRDFMKAETELVVLVTPYMVRPAARSELARPDDNFAPASDLKANFLGHLNRIYGRSPTLPAGDLKGDYGFIVE